VEAGEVGRCTQSLSWRRLRVSGGGRCTSDSLGFVCRGREKEEEEVRGGRGHEEKRRRKAALPTSPRLGLGF
jgi:hypothetical protein